MQPRTETLNPKESAAVIQFTLCQSEIEGQRFSTCANFTKLKFYWNKTQTELAHICLYNVADSNYNTLATFYFLGIDIRFSGTKC